MTTTWTTCCRRPPLRPTATAAAPRTLPASSPRPRSPTGWTATSAGCRWRSRSSAASRASTGSTARRASCLTSTTLGASPTSTVRAAPDGARAGCVKRGAAAAAAAAAAAWPLLVCLRRHTRSHGWCAAPFCRQQGVSFRHPPAAGQAGVLLGVKVRGGAIRSRPVRRARRTPRTAAHPPARAACQAHTPHGRPPTACFAPLPLPPHFNSCVQACRLRPHRVPVRRHPGRLRPRVQVHLPARHGGAVWYAHGCV